MPTEESARPIPVRGRAAALAARQGESSAARLGWAKKMKKVREVDIRCAFFRVWFERRFVVGVVSVLVPSAGGWDSWCGPRENAQSRLGWNAAPALETSAATLRQVVAASIFGQRPTDIVRRDRKVRGTDERIHSRVQQIDPSIEQIHPRAVQSDPTAVQSDPPSEQIDLHAVQIDPALVQIDP
jgi:hypothetical protein